MKTLFNDNWKFAKTPAGSGDDQWDFEFSPVHIPHDWLIYNTENLYESSYGRYIKTFDFGAVSEKSVRLYFEGVYMNCSVLSTAVRHSTGSTVIPPLRLTSAVFSMTGKMKSPCLSAMMHPTAVGIRVREFSATYG